MTQLSDLARTVEADIMPENRNFCVTGTVSYVLIHQEHYCHILVDGKVCNIPSRHIKPGQVVGVRERSKSLEVIQNSLAGLNHSKFAWLEWNETEMAGKFLSVPERSEIPENIKEQLIVELYSKN